MISSENEIVQFKKAIKLWKDPSVEKWMIKIESNMKRTLRNLFRESYEKRVKTHFQDWLFKWPG
jgi:uncharacterized protein (DUF924 family)